MSNRIASSLLFLGLFYFTQIPYALNLRVDLLIALFGNLIVYHVALGPGVFHPTQLLQLPGRSHVQIRSIQVVLAHLIVVVENCKLIMLLRLKAELHGRVHLPTAARCSSLWTGFAVVALLNVLGEISSHILDDLTGDALLLFLRSDQLFVEGILFLSDGVYAVEVVHFTDGARTAPRHFKIEVALLHGRGAHG